MNRPLQLLNPTAKPYVALTPTLLSPHDQLHFNHQLNLSLDSLNSTPKYYHNHHSDELASQFPPDHHIVDLPKSSSPLPRLAQIPSSSIERPQHPLILNQQQTLQWQHFSERRPLLAFSLRLLFVLLASALLLAVLVWSLLPPLDPKDLATLRIPTSFDALKKLNALLQIYKTENYYRVLSSFVLIYLFLQAFSLPGSMYLSILAGAMFGVQVALPLVSLCVGTGAMLCYLMSLNLATSLVIHTPCLRSRLDEWKIKLSTKTNRFDLFSYLVVIRISPLPPHWVVNLLAPHVGIELGLFWFTTCIGILPVSLIHTQLGTTLDQMVGPDDLSFLTPKNLTGLSLVAVGVMTPVLIRWYLKKDLQDDSDYHPTATVESSRSPFSTRPGGLRLESSTHLDQQDLSASIPRRPNHRLRNFSSQTLENLLNTTTTDSSYSSLNKLASMDSSETLLLSSHHHHTSSPNCFPKSSSSHAQPHGFFSKSLTRKPNHVLINSHDDDEDKALLLETKFDTVGRQHHQFNGLVLEEAEEEDVEDDSIEEIKFKRNPSRATSPLIAPRHISQKQPHHTFKT